jgi:hypothetical protein
MLTMHAKYKVRKNAEEEVKAGKKKAISARKT